jgi:L-aminopeptidase/D-esterase-like protein
LTDVPGIRVGHATDPVGLTGCTVVLCEKGAVGGVDVRGAASGTRELAALEPGHVAPIVHGLVLAGGSAFGLDAAGGVMRYLEERGVGYPMPAARVPIVAAAILYDLGVGDPRARPDAAMGYAAASTATRTPVTEGSVGAGTGATVGKLFGTGAASSGGVGSASIRLGTGVLVGALVVVNAYGEVVDPVSGAILAGARRTGKSRGFVATLEYLLRARDGGTRRRAVPTASNTTLAVVATDGTLDKVGARTVARRAHDGLARTIRPAHTMFDGDTIFCLAVGGRRADADRVAIAAVVAVELATVRAVLSARRSRRAHGRR